MPGPQYQYIKLPDGSYGKFNADASDAIIRSAILKDFPKAFDSSPSSKSNSEQPEGFFHSLGAQFGITPEAGEERRQKLLHHPGQFLAETLRDSAIGPGGKLVEGIYDQGKKTVTELADARKAALRGNRYEGFQHLVESVPILGPALNKAAEQTPADARQGYGTRWLSTITDPSTMGTLAGASAQAAPIVAGGIEKVGGGPTLSRIARPLQTASDTAKDAVGRTAKSAKQQFIEAHQKIRPKNMALTPQESATQGLVKGTVPELQAVQRIKDASSELPDALAYADRHGLPVNGKLDAAKAMRGRAAEIQNHYTEKIMRPHSGKFKTVPEEYSGEMSGNGKNQATIGQINDRVDSINRELKSNFRKKLKSQTTEANASDADLNAEKGKLTKILHESLAEMNGLEPEDIASVRQRAGKLRSLAEETELSADRDTVSGGRSAMGSSGVPAPTKTGMAQHVWESIKGGPEMIGNRNFNKALANFDPQETPLPQPVLPDPATTATTPEAAQAEFLHANELEQGSQDAATARNAEAERLRAQNVDTQRQAAAEEVVHAANLDQAATDAATARAKTAGSQRESNTTTQQDLAKQEFVKSQEGEQSAQDAAAARAKLAAEAREGNSAASYEARTGRPHPTKTDSIEETISQPPPTAGQAKPPIQLPAPDPDVHVFSKSKFLAEHPDADADAAAKLAAGAGYEVHP